MMTTTTTSAHTAQTRTRSTPRPRTRDGLARPKSGQVRVALGAVGLSELGVQAAGLVRAVGPEAGGFAPGDRVCYRTTLGEHGSTAVVSERDLIGFPKDVSLEAAAAFLPVGLVARTVVKQLHSIGRGNRVVVAPDSSGADAFVAAWVTDLGASIVRPGEESRADIVVTAEDYAAAKSWRYGHGLAQIAAADVFHEVRRGVFDSIAVTNYPFADAAKAQDEFQRSGASSPIVLRPAA
jgi:NADPH:quinone reductase-like Zn-dependent oxidoreductase